MVNHTIVSHLDIIYAVSEVWVDILKRLRPTIYTQATIEKKKKHCVIIKECSQPELKCCFHNTERATKQRKWEKLLGVV